jgi:hypothetical protein
VPLSRAVFRAAGRLAALTGAGQHQVTYCGVSSNPEDDAGARVHVHHVKELRGNRRVPDGHLLRAVAAELFTVALANDIDVINTYYIDPHATIANRVADALGLLGRRPIFIHSIEGSDVLESESVEAWQPQAFALCRCPASL